MKKRKTKRVLLTALNHIDGKNISEFNNIGVSTFTLWKKIDSPKKKLALSATIGTYLFKENKENRTIVQELNDNIISLREKLKVMCKDYYSIEDEINFLMLFNRDIQNIQENILVNE